MEKTFSWSHLNVTSWLRPSLSSRCRPRLSLSQSVSAHFEFHFFSVTLFIFNYFLSFCISYIIFFLCVFYKDLVSLVHTQINKLAVGSTYVPNERGEPLISTVTVPLEESKTNTHVLISSRMSTT